MCVNELTTEVETAVRKAMEIQDPVMKELRVFHVAPQISICREIGSDAIASGFHLFRAFLPHDVSHYANQKFRFRTQTDVDRVTSDASHIYESPLYEILEPMVLGTRVNLMKVRMSGRSSIGAYSVKELFRSVYDSCGLRNEVPVPLLDLLERMDSEVVGRIRVIVGKPVLTDPTLHDLALSCLEAAISGQSVLDHITVISQRRSPDLLMKVKLYIERADWRAYYVDLNLVRHVTGGLLQGILFGTSKQERMSLKQSTWLPAVKRNIIDFQTTLQVGTYIMIKQGDISSFTNSCPGSWLVVLALLTKLTNSTRLAHLRGPFVVLIDGLPVECCIEEILLGYLFSILGAKAMTPYGEYVSPGGYLGVKCNISLTLLAFCIECIELEVQLRTEYPTVTFSGQLGGDDYVFLFSGTDLDQVAGAESFVAQRVTSVIGTQKEPTLTLVNLHSEATFPLPIPFCKKKVLLTVLCSGYHDARITMRSIHKLPIMKQLLDSTRIPYKDRARLHCAFWRGVQHELSKTDCDVGTVTDMYLYAYRQVHRVPPVDPVKRLLVLDQASIRTLEGLEFDREAYEAVILYDRLLISVGEDRAYPLTVRDVIRILTARGVVVTQHYRTVSSPDSRPIYTSALSRHPSMIIPLPGPPSLIRGRDIDLIHKVFRRARIALDGFVGATFPKCVI